MELGAGFYNPAVALAGVVVGDIGWTRLLVCISAEMVGGFLAAILIWVTYIPHFQPLEVVQQNEENLMCNCCDIESAGVAIIKQELSAPAHR
jgi:glycerol uptake facilitator-like aquaporin